MDEVAGVVGPAVPVSKEPNSTVMIKCRMACALIIADYIDVN